MRREAHIDGEYRYTLDRHWGVDEASRNVLHLVMVNPSVADGLGDDPTIRRCIGYARSLGLDGLRVINLFALRSTDPRGLRTHVDPIGPLNDEILDQCMRDVADDFMVAAWGADTFARDRAAAVHARAASHGIALTCWGRTKDGHPGHPLYLRRDAVLTTWTP